MNIRIATREDLDTVYRLMHENKGDSVDREKLSDQFLDAFVDSNDRAVLLVEDEMGVHGMAVVSLVYRLRDKQCRVDYVFVHESARGKGYGREIMKACDSWAWDHHADEIEFTSRPVRAAANHLYQSADYELRETNVYRKKRGDH